MFSDDAAETEAQTSHRIVSEAFWQSLSSLGKFAALGLGYRPAIRHACHCARCG